MNILTIIALSCLAACVVATCPAGSLQKNYRDAKCHADLVFRGRLIGGSSTMSNDGPYQFFHRRDKFEVSQVFKGSLGDANANEVHIRFSMLSTAECSMFPYGMGGVEKVIFAYKNAEGDYYFTMPCMDNPAYDCINQESFNNIRCPNRGANGRGRGPV